MFVHFDVHFLDAAVFGEERIFDPLLDIREVEPCKADPEDFHFDAGVFVFGDGVGNTGDVGDEPDGLLRAFVACGADP